MKKKSRPHSKRKSVVREVKAAAQQTKSGRGKTNLAKRIARKVKQVPGDKSLQAALDDYDRCRELLRGHLDFAKAYQNAVESMKRLSIHALAGKKDAVVQLARIPLEAIDRLSEVRDLHPNLVEEVAGEFNLWPMTWYPAAAAQKRASVKMKALKVGRSLPIKVETAYKNPAPITDIAREIFLFIIKVREDSDPWKYYLTLFSLKKEFTMAASHLNALYAAAPGGEQVESEVVDESLESYLQNQEAMGIYPWFIYGFLGSLTHGYGFPATRPFALYESFNRRIREMKPLLESTTKEWRMLGKDIFSHLTNGHSENIQILRPLGLYKAENSPPAKADDSRIRNGIVSLFDKTFKNQLAGIVKNPIKNLG